MHNNSRTINKRLAVTFTMAVFLWLSGCGEPNKRLDEYVFYSGPHIKLKLVRYYRNIPFNYLGEHAVVMCQSAHTREFQKQSPHDSGWRVLGDADDQDGKDAGEIAQDVIHQYRVIDEHILVATLQAFNISFDACGTFVNWDPTRLPPHMIHAVEKPDSCAPQGPADCRYLDFEGERLPRYELIEIGNDREVSFTVSSSAFRDMQALRVQSSDSGKLWQVEIMPQNDAPQTSPVPRLQELPVQSSDDNMEQTGLLTWLATALPPHSMVIWPARLTPCDKPPAGDERNPAPRCAEVCFNDKRGNNGVLKFFITGDSGSADSRPVLHSGEYASRGQIWPLKSLRELRDRLAESSP